MQDSLFRYLVEDYAFSFFVVKVEYLLQVPSDGFSFTVFIGREPDGVGFFGFLGHLYDEFAFAPLNDIVGGVAVLEIDAHAVFLARALNVAYVSH